jgi:hypothetical protein
MCNIFKKMHIKKNKIEESTGFYNSSSSALLTLSSTLSILLFLVAEGVTCSLQSSPSNSPSSIGFRLRLSTVSSSNYLKAWRFLRRKIKYCDGTRKIVNVYEKNQMSKRKILFSRDDIVVYSDNVISLRRKHWKKKMSKMKKVHDR